MSSPLAGRAQINNLCPQLQISLPQVIKLFQTLDLKCPFKAPIGDLSVALVTKQEITRLHGEFMDDPRPTDVITFPGDPDFDQAGEICVCPEVAYEYTQSNGGDFSKELTLYLTHGYLHLAGLDDIEESDRQEMRKAEAIALKILEEDFCQPKFLFSI